MTPMIGAGVVDLEAGSRTLIAHQTDVHRAILEDHAVHLCMQRRRCRGDAALLQVDGFQAASSSRHPEGFIIEQHLIDDILLEIVAILPTNRAVGEYLALQDR